MNNPLITICVPIYGTEAFIEKCFLSIYNQTYKNIEMVFVDDCTKDNAISVLESVVAKHEASERVKIIRHTNNKGLAGSRITGIQHATGDYLFFLDSDDTILENAIQKLVERAVASDADIVEGNFLYVTSDGTEKVVKKRIFEDKNEYIHNLVSMSGIPVSVCAKLYNRRLFDIYGTFFQEGIDDGEDYVTTPRIVDKAQTIEFIDDIVYIYYISNRTSYSHSLSWVKVEHMREAFNLLTNYFSNHSEKRFLNSITLGEAFFIRNNYLKLPKKSGKRLKEVFPETAHRIEGESLGYYIQRQLIFHDCKFLLSLANRLMNILR